MTNEPTIAQIMAMPRAMRRKFKKASGVMIPGTTAPATREIVERPTFRDVDKLILNV